MVVFRCEGKKVNILTMTGGCEESGSISFALPRGALCKKRTAFFTFSYIFCIANIRFLLYNFENRYDVMGKEGTEGQVSYTGGIY